MVNLCGRGGVRELGGIMLTQVDGWAAAMREKSSGDPLETLLKNLETVSGDYLFVQIVHHSVIN